MFDNIVTQIDFANIDIGYVHLIPEMTSRRRQMKKKLEGFFFFVAAVLYTDALLIGLKT